MNESRFFKRWTPARHAQFVDYRLMGMHPEWAVFWAMVDREYPGCSVFPVEDVIHRMSKPNAWPASAWVRAMSGIDRDEYLPPKELFDALERTHEDQDQ